jgi:tetratricopeptide (TPR) repeat protein
VNAQTKIQVLSAVEKDKTIEGAKLIFQKNGEASIEAITNSKGEINVASVFNGVNDESVTVIIKKEGYSTLVTKGPFNGMTYALSPKMKNLDGIRFVLSWGKNPLDLDSHISYPGNHLYFNARSGSLGFLDVDDTNSYGPETITLAKKKANQKYIYAVHNFSDRQRTNNTNLSNISGCKVYVYIGSTLIKTYEVPKNKTGNTWVVCSIDENGVFNTINEFHDSKSSDIVGSLLKSYDTNRSYQNSNVISQAQITRAKQLNRQGENAYHAGNLELSIRKYQQAIEIDPYYGQAYSNLGLSFKKTNRVAEAIWANRKAIDLANGEHKNITKASSYYNIAKIYEQKEQWQDAKTYYQKAKNLRQHSAYDKGIARMNAKLAL